MQRLLKYFAYCFPVGAFILFSCANTANSNNLAATGDTLSHKTIVQLLRIDSNKLKEKINFNLLYGNWLLYDTEFVGKYTDVIPLFKDTAALVKKIEGYRKRHMCDGGCVFGSKFTRDGMLYKRIDDYGESYSIKIDSVNNTITCLQRENGAKAPPSVVWKIEITYLDDNYLLEYYPHKKGKPGRTEMLKRTNREL
jgi:hypothetical protein